MTAPNAFIGRVAPPDKDELAATLGTAKVLWDQLLEIFARDLGLTKCEWHSYSRKAGWSLRVKQKERNIVYLLPSQGGFMVAFSLGDRAMKAARELKLPARVLKILDGARRYAEGTAVRIEVSSASDIETVRKLAAVKLTN